MRKFISIATRLLSRQTLIKMSYVARPFLRLFYFGNKMRCPVCGKHFRRFMPYGYGEAKENRLCPGCLSLERHRLLWLFLKQKTDFFSAPLRVLHFAPEQPFLKRFKALKNLEYITADLDSPIADKKLDVTAMDLPDNSFDVILCNHVLEHVNDIDKAFSEILRVLKPGGWAILMVPINPDGDTLDDPSVTDSKERERLFGQYDHVRYFGRDYAKILENAGFEVNADRLYFELSDEERSSMNLARRGEELVYQVKKK